MSWQSRTMRTFVAQLAKAKVRQEPRLLQKRAEQAWRMRWGGILSCAAAKAVATCLPGFEVRSWGRTWEVEADHRHVGLAG